MPRFTRVAGGSLVGDVHEIPTVGHVCYVADPEARTWVS